MAKVYQTKEYGVDPFRYISRDHAQTDERAMLAGHAVYVLVTFYTKKLSNEEFTKFLKEQTAWVDEYLGELFGNTVLVSRKDPLANVIIILERENMIDVRLMDDVSHQGLEKMMLEDFHKTVTEQTDGAVGVEEVDVLEAQFQ